MEILVLWDVQRVTGTEVVSSNLLHVEDSQDPVIDRKIMHESTWNFRMLTTTTVNIFIWRKSRPLEQDIVKLEAHRRGGRQFVGQRNCNLHIFSISGLTQDFCLLDAAEMYN